MTIYTAALTLFFVMDPLGNIPVFLSVLNAVDQKKRKRIILRETCIAFIILTIFLFYGHAILNGMHISSAALSIAGGIILFLMAIKMIFPPNEENTAIKQMGDPFIVPLAIPLVAGPAAMAMVMLFAAQEPTRIWAWFAALAIAWTASTGILISSEFLRKILRQRGLTALERLMGMIMTTMAVQMFLSGIANFFNLK